MPRASERRQVAVSRQSPRVLAEKRACPRFPWVLSRCLAPKGETVNLASVDTSKPVLVTGATGYVAGWIVERLLARGFTVHAAVRDPDNRDKLRHLDALAADDPASLHRLGVGARLEQVRGEVAKVPGAVGGQRVEMAQLVPIVRISHRGVHGEPARQKPLDDPPGDIAGGARDEHGFRGVVAREIHFPDLLLSVPLVGARHQKPPSEAVWCQAPREYPSGRLR